MFDACNTKFAIFPVIKQYVVVDINKEDDEYNSSQFLSVP